jgi:hypothetical protein
MTKKETEELIEEIKDSFLWPMGVILFSPICIIFMFMISELIISLL